MKILLDMSISPNGLIARENGDESWLPSENWTDFLELAKSMNNIVMGREAYQQVTTRYKKYNFDNVECEHKLIVTRDKTFMTLNGYSIVYSPEQAVQYMEEKGVKTMLLIGGGNLNSSFIKAGLIDEIQLTICPYIIGEGRPFIGPDDFDLPLKLASHEEVPEGRIRVRYEVIKQHELG